MIRNHKQNLVHKPFFGFTLYNPLQCSQPTGKEAGQWFKVVSYSGMVHYERPTEEDPP